MPKFKTPVVIHDGKRYRQVGEEVELEQSEIDRIHALHGEFDGVARPQDPGNTQVLNVLDETSIDQLNLAAGIHGGHGLDAPRGATETMRRRVPGEDGTNQVVMTGNADRAPPINEQTAKDPLPSNAELDGMNKTELAALAKRRGVAIGADDTKAEIITALKVRK